MTLVPNGDQAIPPAPQWNHPSLPVLQAGGPGVSVLYRNGGPSLNPTRPPWHRPGNPPDLQWPTRAADYTLPLPIALIPGEDTVWHEHLNDYLTAVDGAFPQTRVLRQEISQHTENSRARNIPTVLAIGSAGPTTPFVAPLTHIPAVYAALPGEVFPYLELVQHAGVATTIADTYAPGQDVLALLATPSRNAVHAQHQTALLLLDYTDHPTEGQDGRFRRCYLYDPQYPGPNWPRGAGAASMVRWTERYTGANLRIPRQLLEAVRAQHAWGASSVSQVTRGGVASSQAWIGGGGSGGPARFCRRMACTWLQQTAVLVETERGAVRAHNATPTLATLQAVDRASDERHRWLQAFVPLVR